MTQEQLAFEANLHRAYIEQIEIVGKNMGIKNPDTIAKALNGNIPELLK